MALLADVSASTDGWVSDTRRIVDVEKEALLVVCDALDALGDRYGIFAFSGEGPDDVAVLSLKSFDERRTLVGRPSDCSARLRSVHPHGRCHSAHDGRARP